jgi:lsr operon transcriptional repressor
LIKLYVKLPDLFDLEEDTMAADYNRALMTKVVWCYYMEDMTQQAISDHLNIPRMRVIKLLERARSEKLIRFTLREDAFQQMEAHNKLMERYNLQYIVLVPSVSEDINQTVAKAAAMYLGDHMGDGDFINIGFGDTASKTLSNLYIPDNMSISLVSLTGGVKHYTLAPQSGVSKANLYIVPAPFIASTPEVAEAIKSEPSVKDVLNLSSLAKFTIIGVGGVTEKATVVKEGNMSTTDLLRLRADSAVGDILGYFVNKEGQIIDCNIYDRLISTGPEKLKGFPNVIAVAGGVEKAEAIDAALKTGCINILITDEDTAKAILELPTSSKNAVESK